TGIAALEKALKTARRARTTTAIVIDTDPMASTDAGGHWWDVPVPEVSTRQEVGAALARYLEAKKARRLGD
ncbi:MAG: 3D-(3,5/4)-trihydroxycyclohexane-1,2-dione acylhydrolase (decyclizing), partial [Methylobacterium sp.]